MVVGLEYLNLVVQLRLQENFCEIQLSVSHRPDVGRCFPFWWYLKSSAMRELELFATNARNYRLLMQLFPVLVLQHQLFR